MKSKLFALSCLLLASPSFSKPLTSSYSFEEISKPSDIIDISFFKHQPYQSDVPPTYYREVIVASRAGKEIWKSLCQQCTYRIVSIDNDLVIALEQTTEVAKNKGLVALKKNTGEVAWRTALPEDAQGDHSWLRNFRGKAVIVQEGKKAYYLFETTTGKLIHQTSLPKKLDPKLLDHWSQFFAYSIDQSGTSYWGLPGGRLFAKSGDKDLWAINLNHVNHTTDRVYSTVNGFFEVNPNTVAVVLGHLNETLPVSILLIDIKTGSQIGTLPDGTSLTMDQSSFYIRHDKSIAAYDRNTLEQKWEVENFNYLSESENIVVDSKYVYAFNIDKYKQLHIVLFDKDGTFLGNKILGSGSSIAKVAVVSDKDHVVFVKSQGATGSGDSTGISSTDRYLKVQLQKLKK